jgi:hypothetical protein
VGVDPAGALVGKLGTREAASGTERLMLKNSVAAHSANCQNDYGG